MGGIDRFAPPASVAGAVAVLARPLCCPTQGCCRLTAQVRWQGRWDRRSRVFGEQGTSDEFANADIAAGHLLGVLDPAAMVDDSEMQRVRHDSIAESP